MKTLIFAISLSLLIFFSSLSALAGIGIIIYNLYTGGSKVMQGFEVFSLSAILFFLLIIVYTTTKILNNTDVITDSMIKFFDYEMGKEEKETNPIQSLFEKLDLSGLGAGSIKMARMEEDGTITPIGEKTFSSPEEILKKKDELLFKAFQSKSDKKNITEMSIEELEKELKKAVDNQRFELAAAIRDLMENKKDNKD